MTEMEVIDDGGIEKNKIGHELATVEAHGYIVLLSIYIYSKHFIVKIFYKSYSWHQGVGRKKGRRR